MILAFEAGDHEGALRRHQALLPVYLGFFRTQGVILTKAALSAQGLPAGPVRSPLIDATPAEIEQLRADCAAAGLVLGNGQ
jgi:4-hydroxy-tetrahydrodipicolinate synthase